MPTNTASPYLSSSADRIDVTAVDLDYDQRELFHSYAFDADEITDPLALATHNALCIARDASFLAARMCRLLAEREATTAPVSA